MSKSGQAYVAATQGHSRTMYSMMRMMGIPLSEEQEKFQAYLERTYPAVVDQEEEECLKTTSTSTTSKATENELPTTN